MGIFSSFKKSLKIKKITKNYIKNYGNIDLGNFKEEIIKHSEEPDAALIAANEIFKYLSNNNPFKDLLLNHEPFKKIDVKLIKEIIRNIESFGYGGNTIVMGHSPAISCFFFQDILYFTIISHTSNKDFMQLVFDIHEYFRKGDLVFKPTVDPRNPQENNES